jgi:sugar phosphate isomerase/epimerase
MWPIYAMDTYFYSSQGSYFLEARCEMLRELGYDGTYLTLFGDATWDDLSRLRDVAGRNELAVAGVWAGLDLAKDNRRLLESTALFDGIPVLELAVSDSARPDSRYAATDDDAARALIEELVARLPDGVEVCLYPHINAWLERFEDTVELAGRIDNGRVGVCFPSYHWYAMREERAEELLTRAGSRLRSVNICGSRRPPSGGVPTIEPLDEGELDNFALLGLLRRLGYRGMIGVQGYSVGGDTYAKLQRSLAAYRDMTRRLGEHPEWAKLRPPG